VFDISKDNLLKDFIKFPKKNLLIILLLLGFGEWFVSDLIHFAGGSVGFFVLCLGGYFYLKNDKPKFNEPNNLDGWINLCNEDLNFFEELEATNELEKQNSKRQKTLESILNRCEKEKISCIGQKDYQSFQSVLKSIFKAIETIKATNVFDIPPHLKNNSNSYVNPHNYPGNWVAQEYLPKSLRGLKIWKPNNNGWEKTQYEELLRRKEN